MTEAFGATPAPVRFRMMGGTVPTADCGSVESAIRHCIFGQWGQ